MATNIAKPSKISLIAALGKNRELGYKNKLLWTIPDDLKRFQTITKEHPIIMGLKTYHSIGRPLPNRTNIVLSHKLENIAGVLVVSSLEKAIQVGASSPGGEEVFVIGGGQVYTQAISKAEKLYLTLVDATAEADTFFPDYSMFTKKVSEEHREHNGLKYTWVDLEK